MADSINAATQAREHGDSSVAPLDQVLELLTALRDADVAYCHWKSNEAIDKTLSAENDLDLLVARGDASKFNTVMHALGFRVAQPSAHRHVPGMVDHFLLDAESGRMVHVQAHYQLVLGDDMTKNFRLPIEEPYLASRATETLIPVPSPAFEFLVFTLRMVVKHCPWDAQLSLRGRLSASERRELAYLKDHSDATMVEALRAQHTPFVSRELLALCHSAITPDAGRLARARTGRGLLRVLEPLGRAPNRTDLRLRIWRRLRRRMEGAGPSSRRKLDNGGLFVALVGGDGSGKSSAVAALEKTFSRHFPTHSFHLGKPPRSLPTRLVNKAMRSWRPLTTTAGPKLQPWTDWETVGFPGYRFMLAHTLTARDRQQAFLNARRAAAGGAVVITDRFPLGEIVLMDSPRCGELPGLDQRRFARWLARREAKYYQHIEWPDLLVVLRVDPDVAVARRREQDEEFVRRRAEEVWAHDWSRTRAKVIDASQPHDRVLAEVHRAVWQAL